MSIYKDCHKQTCSATVNTRGVKDATSPIENTYLFFRLVFLGLFMMAVARDIAECTVERSN